MENNDLILSILTGSFLLAIIIPLSFWLWDTKKENDRLNEAKPPKKSEPHKLEEEFFV